jgi:hypothetical protein
MLWWMTVSLMGYLKSHHALKQEAPPSIRWSSSPNLYTRKKHLVNHSRRLTNSYAKSTNLVNRVEEHLDEELFRIVLG